MTTALRSNAEALHALYERVEAPTRAALDHTPAKFVRGNGNPDAQIIFIGEAPGLDEDRQGKPFIGRAGQLLNKWIASLGLAREDVFITNIVKCHPMKNPQTPDARSNDRPPKPVEIEVCLPILLEEIRVIKPQVIITLGSPSTRTLLNTKETITQLHGRFFMYEGVRLFPLFHPAALFHNPPLAIDVEKDLKTLRQALQSSTK